MDFAGLVGGSAEQGARPEAASCGRNATAHFARGAREAAGAIIGDEAADATRKRQPCGDVERGIGKGGIVAIDAIDAGAEHIVAAGGHGRRIGGAGVARPQTGHDIVSHDLVGLALHEQAGGDAEPLG